jgi:cell division protein FtsI (penicillin-binding protein 3)
LLSWSDQVSQIKKRLAIAIFLCSCGVLMIIFRLFNVMLLKNSHKDADGYALQSQEYQKNIYDRHGCILATFLKTSSIYANPKHVINLMDTAKKLSIILKEDQKKIYDKIKKHKNFAWIRRHVSPSLEQAIHNLGLPGIEIQKDQKRFYPHDELFSHIIGYSDLDGISLGGVEKGMSHTLKERNLYLSLDVRVQYVLFNILQEAMEEFQTVAANAMIMDLKNGEILGSVSLPTFNPNHPSKINMDTLFNRNIMLCSEPGSVLKIVNVAIALETGTARLDSQFDATKPVKIGRFTVTDFKGKNRVLSLAEAFVFSSNIASIKIAETFGPHIQKKYMTLFGLTQPVKLETSENAKPLLPKVWNDTTTKSLSYGYALSVTPIQLLKVIGGVVNDGMSIEPTLLKRTSPMPTQRILSKKTSQQIRKLMRLVALYGSGRTANIEGVGVFGKTGTAYQAGKKGYGSSQKKRTTTFVGCFPYEKPRYILMVMLDDPKASSKTYGYMAAGWNVAPTAGRIIERLAPILSGASDHSQLGYVPGWYDNQHVVTLRCSQNQ